MYNEFFYSDSPEEIEKEKKKQASLRAIFPNLFDGEADNTRYVLINEKNAEDDETGKKSSSAFNKKDEFCVNGNKNAKFDPWRHEEMLDNMGVHIVPGLFGKTDTIRYPRPDYRDQADFDSISEKKFDSVISYSFSHEGGYNNYKTDRETNYGITEPFMKEYKYALPGGKEKPIRDLTKDDARALYKAQWDKYKLGYLRKWGLAYVINDYMINSDARRMAERLQGILRQGGADIDVDGIVGEQTLDAIHSADNSWLVDEILLDRLRNYQRTLDNRPYKKEFKDGWINRLNTIAEQVGSKLRFNYSDLIVK